MIQIPSKFRELLNKNTELNGVIDSTISDFTVWFKDNKLEFFPEYTAHGVDHVNEVLKTSESIITDNSWESITSEDIFVLILSVILHDCAMHLNVDSFLYLINNKKYPKLESRYIKNDIKWITLWNEFMSEALRWDAKKLQAVFGEKSPIRRVDLDEDKKLMLSTKDKMLIGEFLRRHHARLAHEIALNGVPTSNDKTIDIKYDNIKFLEIAGLIARSHNYDLRKAVDLLPSNQRRQYLGCHIPFIMGVLRVSDFIQIQSSRAPKQLLKIKKLVSPISIGEMQKHIAIDEVHTNDDDPEALFVQVDPDGVKTFILLQELFLNIQEEIDAFWALIGEVYGLHKTLNVLGIAIRRIKSNLDDIETFVNDNNPYYVPDKLSFRSAEAEMLNLLVKPLYGDKPEIGIRELLQNSIDACRERHNYLLNHNIEEAELYKQRARVDISIEKLEEDKYLLTMHDNGIGMNLYVIKNYFLNIGASFRNSDSWKRENTDDNGKSTIYRTGRFGVGVLAAFLLGEEIKISTKYINDNDAYAFTCTVEEEFIEVHRDSQDIGTKVSIIINKDVCDELTYNVDWDWFCLKWPIVNRTIKDTTLKQNFTLENAKEELQDGYYRIEDTNYDDIVWTYQLEDSRRYYGSIPFNGLICNGIYITDNLYQFKLNIASSPSISADLPALIIFDQDGLLPLNLQRDDLVINQLPFIDALESSVSEVRVKELIDDIPNIIQESLLVDFPKNKFKFFSTARHGYLEFFPQLMIHNYQYLPFDNYLIQQSKPQIVLLEPVDNVNESILWKIFKSHIDSFIPLLNPSKTIQNRVRFIRKLFYENDLEIPIQSRALIIKRSEIKELRSKNGFNKGILASKKETIINDNWSMYSFANWKKFDIDLNQVVKIMEDENKYAIGIWSFDWNTKLELEPSAFANAWLKRVGSPTFLNS